MAKFFSVLKDHELPEGGMHGVWVRGHPILLARVEGKVYAVSNRCPHMGCNLQGGVLAGFVVMCPCHGWKFDIRNGAYQENPQTALTRYATKVEGDKIYIEI